MGLFGASHGGVTPSLKSMIKLSTVCYCTCSLSLNTFAFEEIIYKNLNNTSVTNPEEERK